MCHSYINAAKQWNFRLRFSCPDSHQPDADILANGENVERVLDPREAVEGAHLVVTDVWSSMGEESKKEEKDKDFNGFTIDNDLVNKSNEDTIILHCLPAYRNKEITDAVIESDKSRIFEQAENRLHAQQALLACML